VKNLELDQIEEQTGFTGISLFFFSRRATRCELKFFHSRLCKQVGKIIITAGQFAVLATLGFIFLS